MANNNDFVPRFYQAPQGVENFSKNPRFGHSRDIASLLEESEDSSDYLIGLVFAAAIVASFFLLFMIVILVCKFCGKRRVGFLSGRPFEIKQQDWSSSMEKYHPVKRQSTQEYNSSDESNNDKSIQPPEQSSARIISKKQCCVKRSVCCGRLTVTGVRGIFIFSGICFILFSILLITQGVTNLQATVKSVHHSTLNFEYLTAEAQSILTGDLKDIQNVARSIRDALDEELNRSDFCPIDPNLSSVLDATNLLQLAKDAVDQLRQLDSLDNEQMNVVADALQEAGEQTQLVTDAIGDVDLTDWEALLILIVFTLVPTMFVSAAILAHYEISIPAYSCFLNWVMMPLFIFMVIVCVVVSSTMITVATINSDFCLPGGRSDDTYLGDSPDATILRVLDSVGVSGEDDFTRKVVNYYILQCQNVENPYAFLNEFLPALSEARTSLDTLNNKIEQDGLILDLSLKCHRDFNRFGMLLSEMRTLTRLVIEALLRTLSMLSCHRIVPIYQKAVYDGACHYSISAVMWVFGASLLMGFFGLVMILMRSAYKPTQYSFE